MKKLDVIVITLFIHLPSLYCWISFNEVNWLYVVGESKLVLSGGKNSPARASRKCLIAAGDQSQTVRLKPGLHYQGFCDHSRNSSTNPSFQNTNSSFRNTNSSFQNTNSSFQNTNSSFQNTNSSFQNTNSSFQIRFSFKDDSSFQRFYEFKLSKYEFKLSKYEFKLSKYEFKLSKYEFKLSKYEFKLSKLGKF